MSSNLPVRLQAALPLLDQRRPGFDPFDPSYREALLQWGLTQIEREYQPDALYRPLDFWRKGAAEREWRKVVAEQGKQQRGIIAAGHSQLAQEAINDIVFEIQERRRVAQLQHDSTIRVQEYGQIAEIDTEHAVRRAEGMARVTAQYQPPQPVPEDPFAMTERYERKIREIQADPALSQEEKHRQTQFWRDALHAALQGAGKPSRG
ncbi:MAG: hypothetical protein M3R02_19675 [Chloroflexota bacterium]|nr:hypothetical protein [Chloroflexota bacterium]